MLVAGRSCHWANKRKWRYGQTNPWAISTPVHIAKRIIPSISRIFTAYHCGKRTCSMRDLRFLWWRRLWRILAVCWCVTPCNLVAVYQHSEDHTVSVFKVAKSGGSRFLRNVGKFLPDYTASHYVHPFSVLTNWSLVVRKKLIHMVKTSSLDSVGNF